MDTSLSFMDSEKIDNDVSVPAGRRQTVAITLKNLQEKMETKTETEKGPNGEANVTTNKIDTYKINN